MTKRLLILFSLTALLAAPSSSQQVTIPRIELMPNLPSPYVMRNWKQVARGYDSLVFRTDASGEYLPLSWLSGSSTNYPDVMSFGLHTVVGTTVPGSAEAINCLPAVIGATLTGAAKNDQYGWNWALMCEQWFNNVPSLNVYKNHPVDASGDDWWYETMPNIFFYQLNDLYPGTGDFPRQFTLVGDRWLEALRAMGGSTTPWHVPYMDHRGWYLQTMTPEDGGVHEPEAAGAIAWLQYNAWVRTGDPKYRTGAEWAMEFLNGYATNPSYELQLSYGVYAAARMNAELRSNYDVGKMVNWCFDVGPLRSWGAIVGNWGGYDCSGLIGEVNGTNDYAFAMNTFEQIGALVPMVRYDSRFARAIGKWTLNAANALRLFYPNSLPAVNQDTSRRWAMLYDPQSFIGHEAMRRSNGAATPYATGDAISGGWGRTTLTLYSSSHAGILGGIADTTDVPGILRLDVLKTDYYHAPAFPTFLYFNPYDSIREVTVDAGDSLRDIYDAATHQFVLTGVSGQVKLPIPANGAVLAVLVPSGGTITDSLSKRLANGVVIDFHTGEPVADFPPRIKSLATNSPLLVRGDTARIYCTAVDPDSDSLSYQWQSTAGSFLGDGPVIRWISPGTAGSDTVTCIVNDGKGAETSESVVLRVVDSVDNPPAILRLFASPRKINLGDTTRITCSATDPDGDPLSFGWQASAGLLSAGDTSVVWRAPDSAGNYRVTCQVSDGRGGITSDSISLEVRDLSSPPTGSLVAFWPLNGNATDASGNGNNGTVFGATPALDHLGHVNGGMFFDGAANYIDVPNTSILNPQASITINFWMIIDAFYTREQYPLSHGNWPNRWKISISSKHLRWTIKTGTGIKDLDSETELRLNTWYNVTVTYNGADMEVWLNGALDAFTSWSGSILTTSIDLTMGRDLPGDQNYSFRGTLDDVRIFDYALSPAAIDALTAVHENSQLPAATTLLQNYPNPFNPVTHLQFTIANSQFVTLKIYDILGRELATLVNELKPPGEYSVDWNAGSVPSGVYFYRLQAGSFVDTRKLVLLK